MVRAGPGGQAGLGFLEGGVAPAVRTALAMAGLSEIRELVGEDTGAVTVPVLRELVEAIGIPGQQFLGDEPVEVADADLRVDTEETLEQGGVDPVAESLALDPEHQLQDLVTPVQRTQRIGLRFVQPLHARLRTHHGTRQRQSEIAYCGVSVGDTGRFVDPFPPWSMTASPSCQYAWRMASLEELLRRMEDHISSVDRLEQSARDTVFELLDDIDTLHRLALGQLTQGIDPQVLGELRASDSAVAWLLDAYGIGVDQHAAAEEALQQVLPYVHSHGGDVKVLEAAEGVIRLRMSGACSGCTASEVTVTESIETALREHVAGFSHVEVEEEPDATPHPPPGPVPVKIERRPPDSG